MNKDPRPRLKIVFGTGDAAPDPRGVAEFNKHAHRLNSDVPAYLQRELAGLDHDFSKGSDHLVFVDGMLTHVAAEVWATGVILKSDLALLTVFHHARALFEMHVFSHWLFQDFETRARRALREHLIQRKGFESHLGTNHRSVESDITEEGHFLIADDTVRNPPSVYDQLKGNLVLERDYPLFWKFASAFVHPFQSRTALVTLDLERTIMENLLVGAIRHAAGTYRQVANYYGLTHKDSLKALDAAESWAA